MPTYEYVCSDCKHVFNVTTSVAEHEKSKPPCPNCKGSNIEWHPAPFFALTGKKS